jgi:hypothetical protein
VKGSRHNNLSFETFLAQIPHTPSVRNAAKTCTMGGNSPIFPMVGRSLHWLSFEKSHA